MTTLEDRLAELITALGTDVKTFALKHLTLTSDPGATPSRTDVNYTLNTTNSNLNEVYINGFLAKWLNEWGALRGSNPYSTFADSLVRAIIPATGVPYTGGAGNYIELQDRRIAVGAGRVTHGRRWSTGQLMLKDNYVHETITWNYGDADPTASGTIPLPTGVEYVLKFTADAATQPVPSWAPSGCLTVRPS